MQYLHMLLVKWQWGNVVMTTHVLTTSALCQRNYASSEIAQPLWNGNLNLNLTVENMQVPLSKDHAKTTTLDPLCSAGPTTPASWHYPNLIGPQPRRLPRGNAQGLGDLESSTSSSILLRNTKIHPGCPANTLNQAMQRYGGNLGDNMLITVLIAPGALAYNHTHVTRETVEQFGACNKRHS